MQKHRYWDLVTVAIIQMLSGHFLILSYTWKKIKSIICPTTYKEKGRHNKANIVINSYFYKQFSMKKILAFMFIFYNEYLGKKLGKF